MQSDKIVAQVRNLRVFYKDQKILTDINLDIYDKSVTTLIGSSGCGKSTVLRCFNRMNDLDPHYRVLGDITLNGVHIYKKNATLLRAKVGMVFQKPNPFPKSIYDNVAYTLRLHGLTNKKSIMDDIVESSLRKVGLWAEVKDRLHDSAMILSGGQQQRLCIARAITVRPLLLLMDEPCSALDPKSSLYISELIKELRNKFPIIMVTHIMKQARDVSDYLVYMCKGKILEYGATRDLLKKSVLIREYMEHE
ncbi:MAG: phosphate ABC transporter, ATP-binding protein [Candidatus Xenolissoclinum pacificiensis L6]|uniref:Phosphate ABC transporter, ATP-binding protein n=1 Tax=Candidatus Xenolissoclinum pacificiensis L6 TaxID=1401685 RepID=W2UZN8_9RICK|nr:MAG: phosphate ABC transporter, ATP-binding protein [Candidatus Xenolissoclinum pacificiensis L6]